MNAQEERRGRVAAELTKMFAQERHEGGRAGHSATVALGAVLEAAVSRAVSIGCLRLVWPS